MLVIVRSQRLMPLRFSHIPETVARIQGVGRRLRALKEDKVELVTICEPQRQDRFMLRFGYLYYDISPKGIALLEEEGIHIEPRYVSKNFTHALLTEQIIASFAIGALDRTDIALRYFEDLLPDMPAPTRQSKHPLRISVSKDEWVAPDYAPFAIERTSDGKRRHIFLEADTGTEPIKAYDRERSSICNKFAAYIHIIDNELIRRQFGFATHQFAFVTRNATRMQSMMDALMAMTERKPSLRRHFLFKTHPTLKSREAPRATGHMLTEPWKRADNPDLQLDQSTGAADVGRQDNASENAHRAA